jgi:hypothetical protein
MHNGNLFALVVKIPFCTESSSEGNPSLDHIPISTSEVSNVSSRNGKLSGTPLPLRSSSHISYVISRRKSNVNGPV